MNHSPHSFQSALLKAALKTSLNSYFFNLADAAKQAVIPANFPAAVVRPNYIKLPAIWSQSHSMVSDGIKPAWILDFRVLIIIHYHHSYRRKTSVLAGAGDGPGLMGDYFHASIVNYRNERPGHLF